MLMALNRPQDIVQLGGTLLLSLAVQYHFPLVEHEQPVPVGKGMAQVMGNHQGGQVLSFTIFAVSSIMISAVLGVQGSGVFIQNQEINGVMVAMSSASACRCPPESEPTGIPSLSSRPRPKGASISLYVWIRRLLVPKPRL